MKLLKIYFLLTLTVMALAAGCAKKEAFRPEPPPPEKALVPADARRMDFVDDLDAESLLLAIDRSLRYYDGAGKNQTFQLVDRKVSAPRMKETLIAFREILASDIPVEQKKKRIAEEFLLLRAAGENGDGVVLFTGYYEPLLEGSLTKTEKYKYPLYRPPPDIVVEKISKHETRISRREDGRLVPYYSRREIDVDGVLQGRGLELIWVSDPVELNSLHTQGSGKIRLE
ncbi:MAG: MltA domain-containing protein, partial [Smithellaceae bacterium]